MVNHGQIADAGPGSTKDVEGEKVSVMSAEERSSYDDQTIDIQAPSYIQVVHTGAHELFFRLETPFHLDIVSHFGDGVSGHFQLR